MSMLEIRDASKVYRTGTFGGELKLVLRRVSFNIDRGEVVSLIGQSGSGKSTLGKIILRLSPLSAGSVNFEGTDISTWAKGQLRDYYRHVQGVFQDPFSSYNPLYKADRVFEMVRSVYFPNLHGRQWHDKIESALESVALNPGDVLNKFPHQLSGGQQQRLLIARALLLEVKLLVADEIISMLDASTRVDVLNLLVDLKRKGLGILFITHDLSLGNYISDKSVILREGAIVEMGETQKVFGNPQHSYTQSLLTAVPQLHRRWAGAGESVPAGVPAAVAVNGSGGALGQAHVANVPVDDDVFRDGEARRYSKSSLYPPRSSGPHEPAHDAKRAGSGPGPRPSLMDIPDQPWQRRFGLAAPKLGAILAADGTQALVECEPGHFVAVEDEL
ncbi:MAG TPA: ATP-binding cassette domain-containing protein [Acidimicrobiales bacterium]|nr:ATP-binding cassette domain-containing protein [Acidimicrobiales bacterium]